MSVTGDSSEHLQAYGDQAQMTKHCPIVSTGLMTEIFRLYFALLLMSCDVMSHTDAKRCNWWPSVSSENGSNRLQAICTLCAGFACTTCGQVPGPTNSPCQVEMFKGQQSQQQQKSKCFSAYGSYMFLCFFAL